MKAIKVVKPFQVEIVDIPKPKIQKADDVIVKITSGGICGSDVQIWNGTNSLATYPRIIGHEFGGIVTEVGSGVTRVKVGDKVAVDPVVSCGHCYACRIGRSNVCSTLEVMGVHRDGGFAEYAMADEKNMHKFHTDFDESLLGIVEPYTIGVHVSNRAGIREGEKVLIMGSGPIGITTMQAARRKKAQVIMTDIVKERLDKALSMGADEVVLVTEEDLNARLDKFTDGEGIPIIVDTVCTSASFEQCIQLASPAGRIVVIGLKNIPSQIAMSDITKKELNIIGSRLNLNCFDEVIAGFEDGSLRPDQLMTRTYSYADIEGAFQMIKEHPQDVLKIVLKFD